MFLRRWSLRIRVLRPGGQALKQRRRCALITTRAVVLVIACDMITGSERDISVRWSCDGDERVDSGRALYITHHEREIELLWWRLRESLKHVRRDHSFYICTQNTQTRRRATVEAPRLLVDRTWRAFVVSVEITQLDWTNYKKKVTRDLKSCSMQTALHMHYTLVYTAWCSTAAVSFSSSSTIIGWWSRWKKTFHLVVGGTQSRARFKLIWPDCTQNDWRLILLYSEKKLNAM